MDTIITIGREMGSGGRTVGKMVAEQLGIPYYDRELIDEAAKESGLSPAFIEQNEQEVTSSFLYNLAMGSYTYGVAMPGVGAPLPLSMQVFFAQQRVIEKLAEGGPSVIVGRCADYILRERKKLLRVFIYADIDVRTRRAVAEYGFPEKNAREMLLKSDKNRARHYTNFTDREWGARQYYDLMIDTATVGAKTAARLICEAVRETE